MNIQDYEKFDRENAYYGSDLGALIIDNKTQFKVWAPEASAVFLNYIFLRSHLRSFLSKFLFFFQKIFSEYVFFNISVCRPAHKIKGKPRSVISPAVFRHKFFII